MRGDICSSLVLVVSSGHSCRTSLLILILLYLNESLILQDLEFSNTRRLLSISRRRPIEKPSPEACFPTNDHTRASSLTRAISCFASFPFIALLLSELREQRIDGQALLLPEALELTGFSTRATRLSIMRKNNVY